MKKLLIVLCSAVLLVGCSTTSNTTELKETATPTIETSENAMSEYEQLPEENVFYAGNEESLLKLLKHGSGVIYLGFDECPWCQAFAPYLNEVSEDNDLRVMYYDILEDRTNDTEFYQELVSTILEQGEDIIGYDNDGNARVYVPLVLYIVRGEIIGSSDETSRLSTDDIQPEEYWTEENVTALKEELDSYSKQVKTAQEETDSQGCDLDCVTNED